ncbi:hypothetical protein [Pumilibacter muris]|uniref:hypothetical protein n=1 Tax=Pumilibacter muris TaxID=2941510 RepID=UPI00203B8C4C|nr:hypothetical protein [Pumilibacter muris]
MRTTTKKSISAFALVCMLVLALATAVVCGGGSLLAARADETTPPAEETPAVAVIVKTVREDMDDASKVKAHVLFAEDNGTAVSYIDASAAPVENLQQYEAYKNKITVNGKPIEQLSEFSLNFVQKKVAVSGNTDKTVKYQTKYVLEIVLNKLDLDWTRPNKVTDSKTTWISEIVIKEGLPLWGDNAPSTEKTLSKDTYVYAGQNRLHLGVRKWADSAPEGKISRVYYENGPEDINKHEITIELQTQDGETGYIFDETNELKYMMRRSKSTIKDNNTWYDSTVYTGEPEYKKAQGFNEQSLFEVITKLGLRYSVGKLITINGMALSDWMTLPLQAAYEAGLTTDAQLHGFATALKDFDGRNDVYIQGDKIKIYLNKTNSFVYNYTDENEQPATKTISWELPDLSESLNVKILPGFVGKLIKLTDGDELTLNTKNGEYDSAREEMEFEEIKLLGIDAPVLENTELIFRLQFDKDPSDGNRVYFTGQNNYMRSLPSNAVHHSAYTSEEIEKFVQNGLFDIARNSIILGGVFGDSTEFRTMSIAEMMTESNLGILERPYAAALHLVKGDNRIAIGGFREDKIVNVTDENGNPVLDEEGNPLTEKKEVNWPFRVKNLKQNFTLTIKAGFRTPAGYELKEDANFIYDYESVKWYKGTSVDDIKAERVRPVIEAIDALPAVDSLTLDDEYDVNDARDFYEELDDELKALVTNLDKLTAAEKKIAELKAGGGTDKPDDGDNSGDNNNTTEEGKKKGCKSSVGAVSVAGAMLMLTAAGVLSLSRKRGKKAE